MTLSRNLHWRFLWFFTMVLVYVFINSAPAHSEVYKWVDENGKVVYGDKPRTENADLVEIKKAPKADAQLREHNQRQEKIVNIMQEEREEAAALKKAEKEKKQEQKRKCEAIKNKYQKVKDATFLYEDGSNRENPVILSDDERKAEELRYQKYIKENC